MTGPNHHQTPRRRVTYTPVFTAIRKAYEAKARYIVLQGSSRSSKTYSTVQQLTRIGQNEDDKSMSIVSPSLPHLKRGAMRDFRRIMDDQGIYSEKNHNKTDHVYNFGRGSYAEFFGAENEGKARGPGRKILYINEANLISFEMFTQLAMRTEDCIIIDFNPADEYSWVYDIAQRDNAKFIHSTYKNNLGNLTKYQIEEIENLKQADPDLWRVYGLGLRGSSGETIYTHYMIIDHFPQVEELSFGLDFGYNHPSALVRTGVRDGNVYCEELLYETKLTISDLIFAIKALGITGATGPIYCDHARPEAIEEMCRADLNAQPADKAVASGIKAVKSRPLWIVKSSTNLLKEIRSYKWKIVKGPFGEKIVSDEPIKFMDDAMDAMRYGIYTPYNNEGFNRIII